jgi:hypothetical membrane protein
MSSPTQSQSWGARLAAWWQSRMAMVVLLSAGIVAVVLYILGDLVSGLLYEGYSYRDQAISELSAFGSPVRPLMVTVILIHALLVVAFGVGVWRFGDRPSLRWAGVMMIGAGLIGFPTHTVFAMGSRGMEFGFNDTMHIALSAIFSLFVCAAMVLSAIAYRGWFRLYAIATLLTIVGFGVASSLAMRGIEENLTPWAGGFERINVYAYFAWIVVLALTMISRAPSQFDHDATGTSEGVAKEGESRLLGGAGDLQHNAGHTSLL